jgi:hypothetical protein
MSTQEESIFTLTNILIIVLFIGLLYIWHYYSNQIDALNAAAIKAAEEAAIAQQNALDAQNASAELDKQAEIAAEIANQQQMCKAKQDAAVAAAISAEKEAAKARQEAAVAAAVSAQKTAAAQQLAAAVANAIAIQKENDLKIITSSPNKFLLQSVGAKNRCLTFVNNKPTYADCDMTGGNPNQIFIYDISTGTIMNNSGRCLDDGGAPSNSNGVGGFYFNSNCSSRTSVNNNQLFGFNPNNSMFYNPFKDRCFDVNSGSNFYYFSCDPKNTNQKWNILPVTQNLQ